MTDAKIIRVLGIDPSTKATGVVLLAIDTQRHLSRAGVVVERQIELAATSPKSTLVERFDRIRDTRERLSYFIASIPTIDIVAFENPFHRGGPSTAALFQAIGAYLQIGAFKGLPIYEIYAATIKAKQGLSRMAGRKSNRDIPGSQSAKIRNIKITAVEWANLRMTIGPTLSPEQDAIADAAAVALCGFDKWQNEQYLLEVAAAGQGKLTLRRSPVRQPTGIK